MSERMDSVPQAAGERVRDGSVHASSQGPVEELEWEGRLTSGSVSAGGLAPGAALVALLVATAVTLYMAHYVGDQRGLPPVDSNWYSGMAAGQNAVRPFANRVLAPWCAHVLGRLSGSTNDTGFYVLGLMSIWVAIYGAVLPVLQRRQAFGFAVALSCVYFWRDSFANYFLPDLFHTALLVVFFSFLRVRWWVAAALMFVPLYLARESTLLLSLVVVPILWRLRGRLTGLLFLAGSLAGMGISKLASRHGLPNVHGIDDTLYMISKVPWNFSKNVLGITLWANTVPVAAPPHIWTLPAWVHLGAIHQIGWAAPALFAPMVALQSLLLVFGLGPWVVACLLLRVPRHRLLPRSEPYLWVAAIYGAVAYLLAPSLGAGLFRLVGYGWPLFLMYLPAVMPRIWPRWRVWQAVCLVAVHLLPCWLVVNGKVGDEWHQLAFIFAADAIGCALLLRAPVSTSAYDSQTKPHRADASMMG